MSKRVLIFDTTGRDGEQAGHAMPDFGKLAWAKKAAESGVDIIEAGFPVSSPGEKAAVARIAAEVKGVTICALARANAGDIDIAWEAISRAEKPRIHTFIPTSDIHLEAKLRKTRPEALAMAAAAIRHAKSLCVDVQFSAEDATRSDLDYVALHIKQAIECGATTFNFPDTVGYAQPEEFAAMLRYLYDQVPSLADIVLSVHCHNDLGLAVANSLAGLKAGARQIEGCWLGIGERAGNAALEQVMMSLNTRRDHLDFEHGFDMAQIGPICRKLERIIAYPIPDHQPGVGKKAFAHSSGIHRHGVICSPQTYEIMTSESVGWEGMTIELVSHLGKAGLKDYLDKIGYDGAALVAKVYPKYLERATVKGRLTDEDLHLIVQELRIRQEIAAEKLFDLVDDNPDDIVYGARFAGVKVRRNGRVESRWAKGDGSIAAMHQAIIDAVSGHGENLDGLKLEDFRVEKGQGSSEAIGWVFIRVKQGERTGYGRSGDPNTVIAAAKAFIYAINHMVNCPVAGSFDPAV